VVEAMLSIRLFFQIAPSVVMLVLVLVVNYKARSWQSSRLLPELNYMLIRVSVPVLSTGIVWRSHNQYIRAISHDLYLTRPALPLSYG
jgi:hypothetical protein